MPPKNNKSAQAADSPLVGRMANSNEYVVDKIQDMISQMTTMMKEMWEQQTNILQREIFDMRQELEREKEKRRRVERENNELKLQVAGLHREVRNVIDELEEEDQKRRNCDVVFNNLPVPPKEVRDMGDYMRATINATLMGNVVEEKDIKKIISFKNKYAENKINVIATFSTENKKELLRQKKLFRSKGIFIKENLTPQRQRLLKNVRSFAEKNEIKFVWTRGGNIYVRKSENASVFPVRSMSDLADMQ